MPRQPAQCQHWLLNESNMLQRTLDTLPPELVFLIFSYLSPVDASCLALCSNHFMAFSPGFDELLGKSFPGVRTGGPGENLRIDFLTRLARHLPQYYLCYACLRLHLWRHIDLPTPNFKLRSCFDSIKDRCSTLLMPAHISQYPTYSLHRFHFVHLHLAMRRFYFGPSFGISAESLTYTDVSIAPLYPRKRSNARMSEKEFWASHRTGLMSVEARVCPNPPGLCLRIQNLAVARRQNVLQLCREDDTVRVCQHIGSYKSNFSHIIRSLIETYCRQDQENIGRLLRQGKCDRCNTSWKLELREIEQKDICLLLTEWKDLGPGLDPEDNRWRTQQDWPCQRTLKASEIVDDPRMRFEMQSNEPGSSSSQALSDENMFLRNVSLLRAQRYRTVMTRWGPGWWYLQGEEDEVKHSQCIVI